ncbi:hypothetical protein [Planktomarina sp.]|uniref:hypothetical protein n=1 Tax=Planktomarina sp. TaxID=2024851 RepID=UPI00326024DC|tara:strand:+ start:264 stop:467 length:204 start_codon:yes stop_codon:yes gene_type:complete
MDVNPAYMAYTNLGIKEDEAPVEQTKSFGLLSRNGNNNPKETKNEPIDRIRSYVKSLRKARKQLTNG